MICLNSTDTLEGGASVNAVVDYSIHGLVGSVFTNIAQGQLNNTNPSVLYTAGAAISIVSVIFVNTHSAAVTVDLYLDPTNAGTPRRLLPKNLSLGIGYSAHYDGARLTILDASGRIATSLPQGLGTTDSPTFADLTDSGLTASQAVLTSAAKKLVSADYLDQAVKVASSPTFVGETLSGLTASLPIFTGASKELVSKSVANALVALGISDQTGWIPAGTFTYASAVTITVATGAALIYQKGDKLKLTQATGGVKYFYIVGVADTLLTITGGTDYTLVSEAITSPYYSHIENPLGFSGYLNWTPADMSGAGLSITNTRSRFKVTGNFVYVDSHLTYPNTADASAAKISLPIASLGYSFISVLSNTVGAAHGVFGSPASSTFDILNNVTASINNATLSTKFVILMGFYEF